MAQNIDLLNNGKEIIREEGLKEFIKRGSIYIFEAIVNKPILRLRRLIPASGDYWIVGDKKIFIHSDHNREDLKIRFCDPFLRSIPGISVPSYSDGKKKNKELIKDFVKEGDSVTVIGAGFGQTSIEILNQVGENGSLTAYEGDLASVKSFEQTIQHYGFEGRVTIHHAIVGDPYKLAGGGLEGNVVNPNELENCDVLEMDCEGSELDILKELSIRPRCMIIEQHYHQSFAPFSDPRIIPETLMSMGYTSRTYDGRVKDQLVLGIRND